MNEKIKFSSRSIWKWLGIFLFIVSIFIGVGSQTHSVKAADISTSVTGLGTNDAYYQKDGSTDWIKADSSVTTNWQKYTNYTLKYNYTIPNGFVVKDGDTAKVTLPSGTTFHSIQPFNIVTKDGTIVGRFTPDSGSKTGTITFNSYYSEHMNDRGGTLTFDVNGSQDNSKPDPYIGKNGWGFSGEFNKVNYPTTSDGRQQYAMWDAQVNAGKFQLDNVVINDTLLDTAKQKFVLDPISSKPIIQITDDSNNVIPDSDYTISYSASDPAKFSIQWNGTLNKTINIKYLSKVTDEGYLQSGHQLLLRNDMLLTGNKKGDGTGGGGNSVVINKPSQGKAKLQGNGQGYGTKFSINVTKKWVGKPDDVKLPESIKVTLYAKHDGDSKPVSTGKSLTLTAPDWKGTFTDLWTLDSNNKKIEYSVVEDPVSNYTATTSSQSLDDKTDDVTITNTYAPAKTSIKVNKVWKDVPKGVNTPPVTATLYKTVNDTTASTGQTRQLNTSNGYAAQFTDLPVKDDSGNTIKYTVKESTVPGYQSTDSDQAPVNGSVTFTNQFVPETIKVVKTWKGVPDKVTTPSITAVLYQTVTENGKDVTTPTGKTIELTKANGYAGTFSDLPQVDDQGRTIKYSVSEKSIPTGYTSTTDKQSPDKNGVVNLVNEYTAHKTSVSVNKDWQGVPDNVKTPSITVNLYANGKKIDDKTLNSQNGYSTRFDNLPETDDNGKTIDYTVSESTVDGYKLTNDTTKDGQVKVVNGKVKLTNQYIPKQTKITVKKTWKGIPKGVERKKLSIQAVLYANGKATKKTVTLNYANKWTADFTDLPLTDSQGKTIEYTVAEKSLPNGYTTTTSGQQKANKDGVVKLVNEYVAHKTSIKVNKNWAGVPDGVKTPSVTVTLYANGKSTQKKLTLDSQNGYSGEFKNLPETDSKGQTIKYTVVESQVNGYKSDNSGQIKVVDGKVTLTNHYIPKQTKITVKKIWKGVPTSDTRDRSIEAVLYANGKATTKTVTLNAANNWTADFTGLPVTDENGKTIVYTVAEKSVPAGYTTSTSGLQPVKNGVVTLVNDYVPNKTSVTVNKIWQGVPKGTNTPSITVTLYANGKPTDKTITLDSSDGYLGRFENLPETDDQGNKITYTVVETAVNGYNSTTTGQQVVKDGAVTLVNVFVPKKTSIKVVKEWSGVPDGTVAPSITATLYANGKATNQVVTLDSSNDYTATFDNLPETDADGNPIIYTVAETKIPDGYTSSTTGQQPVKDGVVTLKNTHTPVTPDTPVTPVTPKTPKVPGQPDKITPGTHSTSEGGEITKTPTQSGKTTQQANTTRASNPQASTPQTVTPAKGKLPQTGDKAKQEIALTVVGILLIGLLIAWKYIGLIKK